MPLTIILQDEQGIPIKISDSVFEYDELEKIKIDDFRKFILIKYIDFYGDTVFNNLQMDDLILDFKHLKFFSKQHIAIDEIIELAKQCKSSVHTYIKFEGD